MAKFVSIIFKEFDDGTSSMVTAYFDSRKAENKKKQLEGLRDSGGDNGLYEYRIKTIGVYTV